MSQFDIPCENCVCIPVCRNKKIKPMFRECELIMTFCTDFVDRSDNRKIAKDMLCLSGRINSILNLHLIPSLVSDDDVSLYRIGLVDIHPDNLDDRHIEKIKNTYRVFKNSWHIDMLDQVETRQYLLELIDKDD